MRSRSRWVERRDLFAEGVASGDPAPDSVLLWTRASAGGSAAAVSLTVEVAEDPGFEQVGGVGMAQGMKSDAHCRDAGTVCGGAEGALDTGATHGGGRGRALLVVAPGGGKEPDGVPMGFPVGAQQRERLSGQRDIPVLGALPAMDIDLEALPVHIGDVKVEGFVEPEAQARRLSEN